MRHNRDEKNVGHLFTMSFVTRESRLRLLTDVQQLYCLPPRPVSSLMLSNVVRMLTSGEQFNDAQRRRLLETHAQIVDENKRLRAQHTTRNLAVERITQCLRDVDAARKRSGSPLNGMTNKRLRM